MKSRLVEKRQEILLPEDLTRDLILSPCPLQDNPYLYKITLNADPAYLRGKNTTFYNRIRNRQGEEVILKKDKKEIYLLLSCHTFPIDLVMPRKKINGKIEKCSTFVDEGSGGSSTRIISYKKLKQYELLLSEEEKEQGLRNWFNDLNPDAQGFIKKSIGKIFPTDLDFNELQAKAVDYIIDYISKAKQQLTLRRGILDDNLQEIFLKNKGTNHLLDLENIADRKKSHFQQLKKNKVKK